MWRSDPGNIATQFCFVNTNYPEAEEYRKHNKHISSCLMWEVGGFCTCSNLGGPVPLALWLPLVSVVGAAVVLARAQYLPRSRWAAAFGWRSLVNRPFLFPSTLRTSCLVDNYPISKLNIVVYNKQPLGQG